MKDKQIITLFGSTKNDEFDFLLRNYYTKRNAFGPTNELFPPADLFETEEEVILLLDLAGIDPTKVSLVYEDNQLHIAGMREDTCEYEKRTYHLMEIYYGPFTRTFDLPANIEPNSIRAKYNNGMLNISMKKKGIKPNEPVFIEVGE